MNRIRLAVPVLAAALALGGAARGAHAAPPPTLVTLKNGLRVVLAPDSAAAGVDVATWYVVGERDEPASLAGARRIAERLQLHGPANTDEDDALRRVTAGGGTVNSTLTPEYACLWSNVPAEGLGDALRYHADRLALRPATAAGFEQARQAAIGDVRARAMRSPLLRAVSELNGLVFRGEPSARPVEGDEAALGALAPAAFETWRAGRYLPGRAVLTIVGRFAPEGTLALVRSLFEPLSRGTAAPAPAPAAVAPGERRASEPFDVPVRLLLAGWRVPGPADPDAPAIELLAGMLGQDENGLLAKSLVQSYQHAALAQAGLDQRQEASMLWTFVAVRQEADSAATEQALLDVVDALSGSATTGETIDRVRASLVTGALMRQFGTRGRAQLIGEDVIAGRDVTTETRRFDAMDRLTPADLQRVAARVFTAGNRSILWLEPRGGAR